MLAVSTRLGPYEILAPLGAGGMGEVYRARDTRLGREVAVKILPEESSNPDRKARFEREAKAVAALSHPNILAIHDYGTEGAVTYAVMELLEGETIRDRLAKAPLSWREAVEIGAAIADGLAAAHSKGIIHRDLKPENLFLTADGRMKILDFGLARMETTASSQSETGPYVPADTDPGRVMGTVGYMSPEQVRGLPADARSDIFSFGCVLYEMLTGRRAFQRETGAETMTAILHDEPRELKNSGQPLVPELDRIVRQCLAKSPNQRLQSARDLSLALRATASFPGLQRMPVGRRFPWRFLAGIAAVLLIGGIGLSAYLLTRVGHRSGDGKPSEEAQAVEAIAVLPFENVGDDPEAEHLSDGIPESIIKSLYEVRSLKVRPFSSVSRYKGRSKDLDLKEIGREINVQAVLTGKLTPRRDGLSLSVELVDVRDMRGIWIEQYDRKRTDIPGMPQEIVKQVCSKLGLQLTGEEQKRLTKRYTENPEAYQLYLRGRYFRDKRTEDGVKKGIEYFKQAIEKDRTYALAYVGLADSYVQLANYGFAAPKEAMPKAKESALKALEIDERLAEAYTTLAWINERYDWNTSEAERRFKRAIELNPNYFTAYLWYAYYLGDRKRFDDALTASRRAQELDPLSPMASATVGWAFYFAREYDQAIEQFKKTLEIDPHFFVAHDYLARAYFQKGMYEEAITAFQKANTLSPAIPVLISELGYTQAVSGKKREAQMALEELKELSKRRYVPSFWFAFLYSGLGDKDRAYEWVEKAYEERLAVFCYIEAEPMFDAFRSDPRVSALLRRIGLTDKTAEREQAIHSVAVLPFVNEGGDPKTEFLSNGVADQIFESLGQLRRRDLKIRSLASVSRYKGQKIDIPNIARELNVEVVVTGKLLKVEDELTITVELVDAREDNQLWIRTFPGKVKEILTLQDRIARDVAANLRLQLTGDEDKRLTKRYTEDPEAYLLYREANYHFEKITPSGFETSIDYCRRALNKDSNYALAYFGMGRGYLVWGAVYRGWRDTYGEAKENLERALKIDNTIAHAHSGLGMLYMYHDWNWEAAKRELELGAELDPTSPTSKGLYALYLGAMNRPEKALAVRRQAHEFVPLTPSDWTDLARCYNWLHQHDQAIAAATRALELDPNIPTAYGELGKAYVHNRMGEKAIAELRQAVDRGQQAPLVRGILGYAYAMAGKRDEAKKVLDELETLAPGRYGFAFPIAQIYAALGEKDPAFDWLRKACEERFAAVIWIQVDPTMENLRKDPRFAQILKEMRLPP